MWRALSASVFIGDPAWAWRRRVIFAGCALALAGVVQAVWIEKDHAWGAVVLAQSWTAFGATVAIYVGLAVTDEHLKRETERKERTSEDQRQGPASADGARGQG